MFADMHNDILTSGRSGAEIKEYLYGTLKDSGIITIAAWTSRPAPSLSFLKETFETYGAYVRESRCAGKAVFAVEDMGFLGGGDKELEDFFGLPIVYAGLVWNNENRFGGGAFCETGLTASGKRAVGLFNSGDIALDFAHMNRKTFYEAAEIYDKPVLCSHACFDACVNKDAPLYGIARARNLDDGQIKTAVERGGLIGLTFVATFLNGTPSCASGDIVRHIDYFVSKFGYAHLGIGTDYFGTEELPADIKEYKDFPVIAEKLSKMGYAKTAIDAILYGNYKKFVDGAAKQ